MGIFSKKSENIEKKGREKGGRISKAWRHSGHSSIIIVNQNAKRKKKIIERKERKAIIIMVSEQCI